jgi:hypothetical protein
MSRKGNILNEMIRVMISLTQQKILKAVPEIIFAGMQNFSCAAE